MLGCKAKKQAMLNSVVFMSVSCLVFKIF